MIMAVLNLVERYVAKYHYRSFVSLLTMIGLLAVYTMLNAKSPMDSRQILFVAAIRNETMSHQQGELFFSTHTELLQFVNAQLPIDATIVLIGKNEISGVNRPVVHLVYNDLANAESLALALRDISKPYIFLKPNSLLGWQDAITFLKSSHAGAFPRRYLQFVLRAEPFIVFRYTDYSAREHFDDTNNLALSLGAKQLLSQYDHSLQADTGSVSVRCVVYGEKTGDALAYTPPITLPVGQHSVDIFLSQQGGASQGDVALLDIFAGGKRQSELMAYKSDFLQENQYQRFSLEFVVEQENEPLEARVFFLGSANLCVQGIRFLQ